VNDVHSEFANCIIAVVLNQDYDSCTTDCVSGDWFVEDREVDSANLKRVPDDIALLQSSRQFALLIIILLFFQLQLITATHTRTHTHLWTSGRHLDEQGVLSGRCGWVNASTLSGRRVRSVQ